MPNSLPDGTVEVVPPDRLAGLAPEWDALWRRCPDASPFAAPAWVLSWTRSHAPDRTAAVALWRGGTLAALVPVFCWDSALLLAGTGPSDHATALFKVAEGYGSALLAALAAAAPERFDQIDLQQLAPGSPLLEAPAPAGWRDERRPGEACHVAPLGGEGGLGSLSPRRRSNWRYGLRRLEREGVSVGLAVPDDHAAATADLLRLHGLRWRERGEAGVLGEPLMQRLLADAVPALAAAGLLRVYEARTEAGRIAVLLVLAGQKSHAYYIGGFDPAWARLSPSAALIGVAMGQAHREGAAAFDFLRGAESYKTDWGAQPEPRHRRLLTPR